ncbi:MAG: pilin [Patescibacteria group bacterium]
MRKISIIFIIAAVFVFVFSALSVYAQDEDGAVADGSSSQVAQGQPGTCQCHYSVSGLLCNTEGDIAVTIGSSISVADVFEMIDIPLNCSIVANFARNFIYNDSSYRNQFQVTSENCAGVNTSGNQLSYDYSLICTVEDETATGGSSPSDGQSQSGGEGEPQPNIATVVSRLQNLQQFSNLPPNKELQTMLGKFIGFLMGITGAAGLAMFIYAGFTWMISQGAAEKQKKAMQIMIWTSLGIIATLASYILVKFLFEAFGI